ncbi:hypothetical protein V5799_005511 [Amblyomma americanum]|uniref:PID domain-containing protein n=1 Tax=Amblyomma americanum TaxID=6943 RepID=A0AAQ4DZ18_AMBAM
MRRLKEAVRACRQHKQRVQLTVSFLGIRIRDEKSWALLHHHPVNRISFISQDTCNAHVVAYIYVAQDDSYYYITVKTEKAEQEAALVALFQMVLDIEDRVTRVVQQEADSSRMASTRTTSTRGDLKESISSSKDASSGQRLLPNTTYAVDELLDF